MTGSTDDKHTVSRTRSRLTFHYTNFGDYHLGVIVTPLGYVTVLMDDKQASLRCIVNGVEHIRQINRDCTVRGIARVAAKFIREKQH
jgi:hypothetical protein